MEYILDTGHFLNQRSLYKQTTCSSLPSSSKQPSSSPSRPFWQTPSPKSAMTSPFETALKMMSSLLKPFWRTSLSPTTSKKRSHCIISFGLKSPSQLSNGMRGSMPVLWNMQRSSLQKTAASNILSREKTCPRLRKVFTCPFSLESHQYWCSPHFQRNSNTPLATGTSYWWVSKMNYTIRSSGLTVAALGPTRRRIIMARRFPRATLHHMVTTVRYHRSILWREYII